MRLSHENAVATLLFVIIVIVLMAVDYVLSLQR